MSYIQGRVRCTAIREHGARGVGATLAPVTQWAAALASRATMPEHGRDKLVVGAEEELNAQPLHASAHALKILVQLQPLLLQQGQRGYDARQIDLQLLVCLVACTRTSPSTGVHGLSRG